MSTRRTPYTGMCQIMLHREDAYLAARELYATADVTEEDAYRAAWVRVADELMLAVDQTKARATKPRPRKPHPGKR